MKLELEAIKENEDGSMDCRINFDEDTVRVIMEYGLTTMFKQAIENMQIDHMVQLIDENDKKI